MNHLHEMEKLLAETSNIESILRFCFKDRSLLIQAFTHRSYLNEHKDISQYNERLEFLGDAVLGCIIANYLYTHLPNSPEGDLSKLRSQLVDSHTCMQRIQKLDIGRFILLGKGERLNDGKGRDSILSDLFEAIIGAIFLDGGLNAATHFIFLHFKEEIESCIHLPTPNSKATLQEYTQKHYQERPIYQLVQENGPDHSKMFCIAAMINGEEIGKGYGSSKKEAQLSAAKDALSRINTTPSTYRNL